MQHGLALDAHGAHVHHLGHCVRRAVEQEAGHCFQSLAQPLVQLCHSGGALGHALVAQQRGLGHAHRIGQIFGAGAHALFLAAAVAPLLPAAQVGRLDVIAPAQVQGAHALGRVNLMPAHREAVDALQLHRNPQPGLHPVHMHGGARVLFLHPLCQPVHVHQGADLVVHLHAAHQDGVFVHRIHEGIQVQMAGLVRVDGHHIKAQLPQPFHGHGHAGMLVAAHHHPLAPAFPGQSRTQNGDVVALGAAAGEEHLLRGRAQSLCHPGAGLFQQAAAFAAGAVQAGGVGPVLDHGLADGIRHCLIHDGGGGVIQIMEGFVVQHSGLTFYKKY